MNTMLAPVGQGFERSTAQVGLLRLTESHHSARSRLSEHAHSAACMTFVLAGHLRERIGQRAYDCVPGTCFFKPPGIVHDSRFEASGAHCLVVEIDPDLISRFELERTAEVMLEGGARAATSLHEEFQKPDGASTRIIEGVLRALLERACRAVDHDRARTALPAWLGEVRKTIDDRFWEAVSVGELARRAGVKPDTLSRQFKRHFGMRLREYVQCCRVEAAATLLTTRDTPLATIATDLGFYDQSHFTAVFRAKTGLTPGRYRAAKPKQWTKRRSAGGSTLPGNLINQPLGAGDSSG